MTGKLDKDELRALMREKRRALSAEAVSKKSALIREALFSLDRFKNAHTVCTYISAFKEPDTLEIIKRLLRSGKDVAVPITQTSSNTLTLSYITDIDNLKSGTFGILEPVQIQPADITDIDALLVPGLAFDNSGGRMGFGKGYYDRLLTGSNAVKIGLCYDFQLLGKIPSEPHDVPMDIIVTESGIYEM